MVSLGAPVRFLHQGKLNRVLKSGSASLLVDPGTEPFVNMRVPEVSVGPLALPSQLCTLFLQAQKWLSSLPILLLLLLLSCFSRVWLWATPWTAAYQAPPSMGFSRQEYWSGLSLPSPSLPILHISWCHSFHQWKPISNISYINQQMLWWEYR